MQRARPTMSNPTKYFQLLCGKAPVISHDSEHLLAEKCPKKWRFSTVLWSLTCIIAIGSSRKFYFCKNLHNDPWGGTLPLPRSWQRLWSYSSFQSKKKRKDFSFWSNIFHTITWTQFCLLMLCLVCLVRISFFDETIWGAVQPAQR